MSGRIARSTVSSAGKPRRTRQKNKRQTLDAYATAAKAVPEARPRGHRLGEFEDEPKYKRRRIDLDEEDAPRGAEEEQGRRKHNRKPGESGSDGVEYGSDSSGNEWVLGGIATDDDDSDIDSDEAFGESDEERFAGFTFRGSSSGKKKHGGGKLRQGSSKSNVDLDESSDDGDGSGDDSGDDIGLGLGEDAVDLATMLDDDPDDVMDNTRLKPHDSEEDSEGESEISGDSDGAQSATDSDDDDDNPLDEERIARMQDRLDAMDSSNTNERSAPLDGELARATLDDFLEDTDLQKTFQKASKSKKRATDATAIAAPLPRRQQARLDRETATAKANEQFERWKDTVVKNRRAEHLMFPLQNMSADLATVGKEKFAPVSQETPRTGLEETIQQIMQESGLAEASTSDSHEAGGEESALLKSEELGTNKLPIEEVMRRRAELRKARHLLFREEIKAKRIAKIKSKSYRKVHRKERQRLEAEERQAIEELGLDDIAGESEQEKADRARAEARVATKHKDSKWAKALKATNRAAWDESARDGVFEQARRTEELRKRIAGKENLDDDSLSSDADAESSGDDDNAKETQLNSVSRLDKATDGEGLKGLSALKFMRTVDERQRKANEEDLRRLRREIAEENGHELDSDEDDEDQPEKLGRAIYGPQPKETASKGSGENRLDFEAPDDTDSENDKSRPSISNLENAPHDKQVNGKPKSALRDRRHNSETSADLGSRDKSAISWLQAPKTKSKHNTQSSDDVVLQTGFGATSELDTSSTKRRAALLPAAKPSVASNLKANTREAMRATSLVIDDADNGEPEPLTEAKTLKQRAFAGDDVHIAFDAEKDEIIASEDEKEISSYLPGWGSWAGEGLSKREKKANSRSKHNPLFKSKTAGVKRADRKDANLKNVIISEKNERKGRKYLAPQLPHEFESQEQYERSRRLPMGPEWTTKEVHQTQTRPRVVVKPGVIINALERPLV